MTSSAHQVLRAASRWLFSALALATLCHPAYAQTVSAGKYNDFCMGCHGSPLHSNKLPSDPPYHLILTWPALNVTGSDADIVAAMRKPENLGPGVMKDVYFSIISNRSDEDLLSIYHYLRATRDSVVNMGTAAFANTGVGSSVNANVSIKIDNYRGSPLNRTLSVVPAVSDEFTLVSQSASPGCAGSVPAAASSSTPATCTIDATIKFQPSTTGSRTGDVRLALSAPTDSVETLPLRTLSFSATAFAPFTLSANTMNFTTNPGVKALRSINLGNNGGTPIDITGLTFSPQAIAAGYSLDSTNECPVNRSLAANGDTCILRIAFTPAAEVTSTPDAKLTIEHNGFGDPAVVTLNGVATAVPRAVIELSPASTAAFEARIGSSAPKQTIVIHNGGNATLQFSALTLGGAVPSDYERGGTCTASTQLQVGPASNSATNCTIELTFRPGATGPRNATLTITSNALNNPIELALAGTGLAVPAARVELSPGTQLDFGQQTIGGIYPARSVSLTNSGTAALSIASVAVEGAGFANAGTTPCPATLAIGATCTINIRFTPTTANTSYAGTLRIASDAPGSPHSIALVGSGTAAAIPVLEWTAPAATTLDFGLVSAGSVSDTRSVTFVNKGPGGVDLSIVNAVGPDAEVFSVDTSGCAVGQTLPQDQPCRVDIRFAPGSAGAKTATLQIASSGSPPATLTLVGTGLGAPSAGLALSATTLIFDPVRVGAQSLPVELTLSATGAGAVNVTGLQASGPYSVQSKTCAQAPFQLNAGSSCTVTVTFQPQTEGSASGTLRITTDLDPAQQEVALNGTGQAEANVSSGGCSMVSGDAPFDPTLWALVLLAAGAIAYRRRARAAGRRS